LTLSLETEAIAEVTVLYCKGRLATHEEAAAFSGKVAQLLEHTRQLVIELSEVETIESAALGELIVVHMWARASGCVIHLSAACHRVRRWFEAANLTSVLAVHPTFEEAVLCCQRSGAKKRAATAA